jgi:hypothetical protein
MIARRCDLDVEMRILSRLHLIAILALCALLPDSSYAQNAPTAIYPGNGEYRLAARTALVIGVPALKDGNGFLSLKNPGNDASRVTDALRRAGFSVTNLGENYQPSDITRQNIKKAVYDFSVLLKSVGGVGLIYYSGHGAERNGNMYLLPFDAYVEFERDLNEELTPVSLFYDAFKFADNPLDFLVIDACRDNAWTKPFASFGSEIQAPVSTPSSKNVFLVTSTLSGHKTPDGTGDVSPFAEAFAKALEPNDRGLSEVFGSIGTDLDQLNSSDPDAATPIVDSIPGRDFVFVPTVESFNREEAIFNSGITTGNRKVLTTLIFNYSGGYFYSAAKALLSGGNLAPTPAVPPAPIIKVVESSNLRTGPSLGSEVASTESAGTLLNVVGATEKRAGSYWFPVKVPSTGMKAFVRTDRVSIEGKSLKATTLAMDFTTSDALSAESLARLSAEFQKGSVAL